MIKKIGLFVVITIIGLAAIGYRYIQNIDADMKALYFLESPVHLDLKKGSTLADVSQWFNANGMLEDERKFKIWLKVNRLNPVIKAGYYEYSGKQSVSSILSSLESGDVVSYSFTIIEGSTIKDMLVALSNAPHLVEPQLSEAEVMNALGVDAPKLEGLLFPDTYQYGRDTKAIELLRRSYERMQQELAGAWAQKADDILLKSPYEALIMASIIEKETAAVEERPLISGVFNNRLKKGMLLQTDPTVIYGVGESYDGDITRKHLRTDTPYNTYTRKGLPPTPIAFAGKAAIMAAVQPQQTDALYFVATGENGTHYFSKTLAEHNRAVRKYILKK